MSCMEIEVIEHGNRRKVKDAPFYPPCPECESENAIQTPDGFQCLNCGCKYTLKVKEHVWKATKPALPVMFKVTPGGPPK